MRSPDSSSCLAVEPCVTHASVRCRGCMQLRNATLVECASAEDALLALQQVWNRPGRADSLPARGTMLWNGLQDC